MSRSLQRGDRRLLLEFVRTHERDPELADLIDAASKEMRRELGPRRAVGRSG